MNLKIQNNIQTKEIISDDISFKVLEGGDIFSISYFYTQISMYRGTNLDGGVGNIYLRTYENDKPYYTKLLGVNSPSSVAFTKNAIIYQGKFRNVCYKVIFSVIGHIWYWTVQLSGTGKATLFYGQDISLSGASANEAYVCQYLDHRVVEDNGYHIISSQNQGDKVLVQSGALTNTIGYATDGFDFFGTSYKFTNQPKALVEGSLPSRIYQYEFAYHTLQTETVDASKNPVVVFYSAFANDFTKLTNKMIDISLIRKQYSLPDIDYDKLTFSKINLAVDYQNIYPYKELNNQEKIINCSKADMIDIETIDQPISWFDKTGKHYVAGIKEKYLERPQGIIHITNGFKTIDDKTFTDTNWIFGVFNSHIAYGNTNFNKMITHNKTPLNILKTSGERLFVELDGKYYLLSMPAVYVMDISSTSWYYQLDDDVIKITSAIAYDQPFVQTEVVSLNNKKYNFILTDNLVMGPDEFMQPICYKVVDDVIRFEFFENTLSSQKYSSYHFNFKTRCDGKYSIGSDEMFYSDQLTRGYPLLAVKYQNTAKIEIIHTALDDIEFSNLDRMIEEYNLEFNKNTRQLHIEESNDNDFLRYNHIIKWYTHNALIHYSSPHGLEQYGGAAWGTRDVCQGPIELFSSFNHYDIVRDIIKQIYSRQIVETYDWPQWFMFDKYKNIQAEDSHGDIIVWPLRTIAFYIKETADLSILDEVVPYSTKYGAESIKPEAIIEHIRNQIKNIVNSFIPGTHLPRYGGGDWDDTLQPCNRELTKRLVSGWTVLLLLEALDSINEVTNNEFKDLAQLIRADYQKYLLIDGVPSGFVYFGDPMTVMLHPNDQTTGIHYRLLPFNRGIISEQFDKEMLDKYLKIIDENLWHPDGVRLMNTTVHYQGGTPKIFLRAETATNFGREIGLQYVHAHIRYTEAMAKIGNGMRVFQALNVVCPINIKSYVPNALPRQANVYFSSSDGDFLTRYQADKEFDLLRTGKRNVKGGWRLYSSGPGIYLNQLIRNFLGIKTSNGKLLLDPVMPESLKGTKISCQYQGKTLNIEYAQTNTVTSVEINGKVVNLRFEQKYRQSGIIIENSLLEKVNNIIIR